MADVTHNITMHTSVTNIRYSICLKMACIFSKFYKLSNALICIAQTKDSDTVRQGLNQNCRKVLPLVAMLKLVKVKSRTHTSWIISCLRQRFCVESDGQSDLSYWNIAKHDNVSIFVDSLSACTNLRCIWKTYVILDKSMTLYFWLRFMD